MPLVNIPELDETINFPDDMPHEEIKKVIEGRISEKKTPIKTAAKKTAGFVGNQILGTAETAMSISSSMVLWPFSKLYGLMALPFGAEAAKIAESEMMSLAYQPYKKEGQEAVNLVGKGIETYLTPTKMAVEEVEKVSPRAAWLTQLGGELVQFAAIGAVSAKGKVAIAELKARPRVKASMKNGVQVQDLIRQRRANIDSGILDSEIFIRQYPRKHTVQELEAIPFIRQGIKDPEVLKKIGKEELIPIIEKPSPEILKSVDEIGKYYDEAHEFLKQHWDKPGFVENYVTQIWDIPKSKHSEVVNHFAKNNPFLKKRTIPTLEAGIEIGLKPKTTNIVDLLRIYDQYKIKTAFNKKFAEQLKSAVSEDGSPLMMRGDKAPEDWVKIDHTALNRTMMVGKTTKVVYSTDTFKTITETINKIKTIERTIPEGGTVTKDVSNTIKSLENVMQGALEARGMTPGEASAYLNRLKTSYATGKVSEGKITEKITNSETSQIRNEVFNSIEKTHPIDIPILQKVPVRVHPEIAKEVKIIFDKPFSHEWITAYETVNAFTKKSMLTISFFHHFALTESAFATGIGGKAVKMWNPLKIYEAVKKGDFEIYKQQPLAKDAIENGGVNFGALSDVQRNKVQNALESVERATKDVPIVGKAAKAVRTANQLWDTALWDYYHNNLKLYAYESGVEAGLKGAKKTLGRDLTPQEIRDIKFEIGQFVNDSFGGQNWELSKVFGNPKIRQMMHWVFLAPDWTLSTIKQATAPARGPHLLTVNDVAAKARRARGMMFWAKSALYFNLIAQSANYYNTKKHKGDGRFTWENSPGHKLNIYAGQNPDGTERYIRLGKQFREVLEWGIDPLGKMGSKSSPALREMIRQFAKSDPGSGYPTPWRDKEFWDITALKERGLSILEMPIPFSLRPYIEDRPTMFMFSLPASKGMTNYKTVKLFKEAINKKSRDKVQQVYFAALENNLDAQSLFISAKSAVKADMTFDNKTMAKEIWKELKSLAEKDPNAAADALQVYKDRGVLTPEIHKKINDLIKKELSVKKQKEMFNIK